MKGLRTLSVGEWLTLAGIVVAAAVGGCEFGYALGQRNTPTPNLQWGGPDGCGYGFTRVPIANWLGPGEPMVCKPVPD